MQREKSLLVDAVAEKKSTHRNYNQPALSVITSGIIYLRYSRVRAPPAPPKCLLKSCCYLSDRVNVRAHTENSNSLPSRSL